MPEKQKSQKKNEMEIQCWRCGLSEEDVELKTIDGMKFCTDCYNQLFKN